jgi:hypothetical protein
LINKHFWKTPKNTSQRISEVACGAPENVIENTPKKSSIVHVVDITTKTSETFFQKSFSGSLFSTDK